MASERNEMPRFASTPVSKVVGARLPTKHASCLWDIDIAGGVITNIQEHSTATIEPGALDACGGLLTPSLCHAHIHLDKCFLLNDEKYADLEIIDGDFNEAMNITGQAKQRFEEDDLLRRGARLIEESVAAGVTAMRAFVEVDEIVGLKCVDAGLKLKEKYRDICHVQICAFAQLALFSAEDGGSKRRMLMMEALQRPGVDVVGSTPYVEDSTDKMLSNVAWTIEVCLEFAKHLDFHLDYNLDSSVEPLVWNVIKELRLQRWADRATHQRIALGHCTRLTMLSREEWKRLKSEVGPDLTIAFIGLPTSDLFMMGRPKDEESGGGRRDRGTLQVPQMIKDYGLDAAISINNIGNAFTPYGTCDPLRLACFGVGVYQSGTKSDSAILFETISSRAMKAIGCDSSGLEIRAGDPANLVLFSSARDTEQHPSIFGLVHSGGEGTGRIPIFEGRVVEQK